MKKKPKVQLEREEINLQREMNRVNKYARYRLEHDQAIKAMRLRDRSIHQMTGKKAIVIKGN